MESHIVPEKTVKMRLNEYIHKNVDFNSICSRKAVQKAIKRDQIKINGKYTETGYFVKPGDIIEFKEIDTFSDRIFGLKLNVIYEDKHIAVIDKPAGFDVNGNKFKTIENSLSHNLKLSDEKDALLRPVPVHRLDNPTRGLLLIAKTASGRINLSRQFEERTVKKTYNAVVVGKPDIKGNIEIEIDNRFASTDYKLLNSVDSLKWDFLSLVELNPFTGRKHQLRIHLSKSGFPVLGDKIYCKEKLLKGKGLFLCAVKIEFKHPKTDKTLIFEIDPPNKFNKILESEQKNYERYGLK